MEDNGAEGEQKEKALVLGDKTDQEIEESY